MRLVERVCEWLGAHLPKRMLTRVGGSPYMLRHYLQRHLEKHPSVPGLYLHCFLASDDLDLHNHPFEWSVSLVLSGGYFEDRLLGTWGGPAAKPHRPMTRRRFVRPWRLNFIRANDFHRVDLKAGRAWTLFLAGPRVQDWGFLDARTGRYTDWRTHETISKFNAYARGRREN